MITDNQSKRTKDRSAKAKAKQRLVEKIVYQPKTTKQVDQNEGQNNKFSEREVLEAIGKLVVAMKDEAISKAIVSSAEKTVSQELAAEISRILLRGHISSLFLQMETQLQHAQPTNHWEENLGLVKEAVLEK